MKHSHAWMLCVLIIIAPHIPLFVAVIAACWFVGMAGLFYDK